MQNKLLVIIIAVVAALLLIGGGIAVYFVMNANKPVNNTPAPTAGPESEPAGAETAVQPAATSSTNEAAGKQSSTTGQNNNLGQLITKDAFSLQAPDGWQEAQAPTGVLFMLVNNSEQVTNAVAKQAGFKTYLSVIRDNLGSNTKENYLTALQNGLKQALPGVTFTKDNSTSIGGQPADVLEASVFQQGINFKALMFVISGKDKDVWIVAFNTLSENFSAYKNLFYQIAGSFKLK